MSSTHMSVAQQILDRKTGRFHHNGKSRLRIGTILTGAGFFLDLTNMVFKINLFLHMSVDLEVDSMRYLGILYQDSATVNNPQNQTRWRKSISSMFLDFTVQISVSIDVSPYHPGMRLNGRGGV